MDLLFASPSLLTKCYLFSGDSYSDVGYIYSKSSVPTDEAPLGIEFPGITWAEPAMPNWVGHLITEYSPGMRLLVYDYAIGGDRVVGVRKQVQVNFLPRVGERPDWARWHAEDSLFGVYSNAQSSIGPGSTPRVRRFKASCGRFMVAARIDVPAER